MAAMRQPQGVPTAKMRILCLHGYMQTGSVFRMKIGSLRKALKSRADFVFVDAPFQALTLPNAEDETQMGATEGGRAWWRWQDTASSSRPSLSAQYSGWEEAYGGLLAALKEHHPIDGILGFSQGATATALLLSSMALDERAGALEVPLPKFAIMVAGFLPRDPAYARLLQDATPCTPSLFIYGQGDQLVPPERVQQLLGTFSPGAVTQWDHPGAHLVPTCSGEFKQRLHAFLDQAKLQQQQQQQQHQEEAARGEQQPAADAASSSTSTPSAGSRPVEGCGVP